MTDAPARLLDGRFSLEGSATAGAYGEIFRATDRATGRPVAIKRLRGASIEASTVKRFHVEARALARVDHPNVVRYIAHGTDAFGEMYLALEWLEGEDLRRRMSESRVGVTEAVEIARQAALGLAALHHEGIIHRDIKPSNIFLLATPEGRVQVKLVDLGIARVATEPTLTVEGYRVGTPSYMSPEQASGEGRVSARTDQFSLGVVLYEVVTGQRPFIADNPSAIIARITTHDPPPPRQLQPLVTPGLDAVITRAMAKTPARRYASAREMAGALGALATSDGSVAPPAPLEPVTVRPPRGPFAAREVPRLATPPMPVLRPTPPALRAATPPTPAPRPTPLRAATPPPTPGPRAATEVRVTRRPDRSFADGEVLTWRLLPAGLYVVLRVQRFTLEHAHLLCGAVIESARAAHPARRVALVLDWRQVTEYETSARTVFTSWALAHRDELEYLACLAPEGRSLVAMGLNVTSANLALGGVTMEMGSALGELLGRKGLVLQA